MATLSWSCFVEQCEALVKRSERMPECRWDWRNGASSLSHHSGQRFLALHNYYCELKKPSERELIIADDLESLDGVPTLASAINPCVSDRVDGASVPEGYLFDYHIVYSPTYQVPVLYLNASNLDGEVLSTEELWNVLRHSRLFDADTSKWSVLTQGEHPVLGVPYLFLHPCQTADFMKIVWADNSASSPSESPKGELKVDYLTCWLALVGPLVGLSMPLATTLIEPNV
eukprot:GILJ01003697.1.p1 GENE.GILJ01003697.1~~GILJ01003697.1.p1  ORF type:complete len:229 (-),score=13.92 GILJ01003697.1:109-795(-)